MFSFLFCLKILERKTIIVSPLIGLKKKNKSFEEMFLVTFLDDLIFFNKFYVCLLDNSILLKPRHFGLVHESINHCT